MELVGDVLDLDHGLVKVSPDEISRAKGGPEEPTLHC